jgi:hypothetical protein
MGDGDMERVRRAVAVEVENPPPELSAVEEPYRKIVKRSLRMSPKGVGWRGRGTTSCTAASESSTPCPPS